MFSRITKRTSLHLDIDFHEGCGYYGYVYIGDCKECLVEVLYEDKDSFKAWAMAECGITDDDWETIGL